MSWLGVSAQETATGRMLRTHGLAAPLGHEIALAGPEGGDGPVLSRLFSVREHLLLTGTSLGDGHTIDFGGSVQVRVSALPASGDGRTVLALLGI